MSDIGTYIIAASRAKTRFASNAGDLSFEDLWDLPMTSKRGPSLDDVGKRLLAQKRTLGEESLVTTATRGITEVNNKLELVKYVIGVRQAENAALREQAANAERKQRLLGILQTKQAEADLGRSIEDLEAEIASL